MVTAAHLLRSITPFQRYKGELALTSIGLLIAKEDLTELICFLINPFPLLFHLCPLPGCNLGSLMIPFKIENGFHKIT